MAENTLLASKESRILSVIDESVVMVVASESRAMLALSEQRLMPILLFFDRVIVQGSSGSGAVFFNGAHYAGVFFGGAHYKSGVLFISPKELMSIETEIRAATIYAVDNIVRIIDDA